MYDVIIIGARCAGSPTAILLSRKGYRVLLVDRASFPSDTLSTHQVQLKGGAALQRWGLFDRVTETNCPPIKQASFQLGNMIFSGQYPPLGGVDSVLCPRRTVLDKVLVDAAVAAGAELRQDLVVEELVMDRGQVVGIRGRVKTAGSGENKRVEETARLVIGADGKHSLVAKVVSATEYNSQPALSCAYYTYWEGLESDRVELYSIPKAFAGIASTNDGLAMIYTGYPASEFNAIRGDIEGRFWTTMESIGQAERLLAGRQADRFYGSVDLPNYYRRPYGAGWALVGDSGMNMDPITGQGIGNAFVDVERLVEAVDSWFSGRTDFDTAMSAYEKSRNADTMPIVEFTLQAASFAPPPIEQLVLFEALMHNKKHASQFFGALSGSVSLKEFFATGNIFKIIGPGGMGRVFLGKIKPPRRAAQAAG